MKKRKGDLAREYICPKCRGREPLVREIALSKSGLLGLVPSRDNRYVEVTCSLCGYTEFYNRAILEKSPSVTESSQETVPLPDRAEGG